MSVHMIGQPKGQSLLVMSMLKHALQTSNVSGGSNIPTLSPNQVNVALTKALRAMKAIRLAAIFATRAMAVEAPAEAASIMFLSGLKKIVLATFCFNEMKTTLPVVLLNYYSWLLPGFHGFHIFGCSFWFLGFWVKEFGHGKCCWSRHHGCRN